ncbi:Uncharacterised protein [Vibrio cholerae]|nr:Uncharacterised protein [Vibrio cholerae]
MWCGPVSPLSLKSAAVQVLATVILRKMRSPYHTLTQR